jgi:hypothetical protein
MEISAHAQVRGPLRVIKKKWGYPHLFYLPVLTGGFALTSGYLRSLASI